MVTNTDSGAGGVMLLVVLGLLLVVGVMGSSVVAEDAADRDRIEGETLTQSGDPQPLAAAGDRYENELVENHEGVTLEAGTDYTLDSDTGEIVFMDTADTEDGAEATIEYDAVGFPGQAAWMVTTFGVIWETTIVLPLIAALGAILAGLAMLQQTTRGSVI